MKTILYILLRFLLAVGGFVVACFSVSVFFHVLYIGALGFGPQELQWIIILSIVFSIPFVAFLIGYFAALPAVVIILAAEILRRRDWLTYALAGGAVGLAITALFWQGSLPSADGFDLPETGIDLDGLADGPGFIAAMVGGGIVGGTAYWLLAGQFGTRRPPRN